MPSGSGEYRLAIRQPHYNTLTTSQGFPEAHLLLLRRPLHQLQGPHHRIVSHLQDTHLALRHQPRFLLSARHGSAAKRYRSRRGPIIRTQ